jgi:hypothetical protein
MGGVLPPPDQRNPGSTGMRLRLGTLLGLVALSTAVVLYAFPPDHSAFYPRCLFFRLTGLQCPGCGGLRAAHHLLHGDWAEAWRLNPLTVLLGPLAAMYGLAEWARRRTGRDFLRVRSRCWLWLALAGVGIFTVLRNLPG